MLIINFDILIDFVWLNYEIIKLIIDNNIVLTKCYQNPKNINQWNLGRCRIDANFFVEAILDYFLII